ncbi:MAG TPA: GntR family transcriptional regulator [Bryobacteraceae bacterium]|jgi:DNA-binding GntR family transcriptional regulator|nr:GntR family transcriptional regulator [Bryobacteraceae bacterium]
MPSERKSARPQTEQPGTSLSGKKSRSNSQEFAFKQLREMIVTGRLAPGTWMIEADIADRLSISRTPVRGALHWLQRDGYVIAAGNGNKSRLIVAPLTKDDARDLYAIIGHLEGLAGRQTAQLPQKARATVVRRLKEFNAALAQLSRDRRSEPNRIFELDLSFHRTIMEASAGPRLKEIHRIIHSQVERYWRLYSGAIVNKLSLSVAEHNEIIKAVSSGDPDRAEKGLQTNWQNGVERLSTVIDSLGERGNW